MRARVKDPFGYIILDWDMDKFHAPSNKPDVPNDEQRAPYVIDFYDGKTTYSEILDVGISLTSAINRAIWRFYEHAG